MLLSTDFASDSDLLDRVMDGGIVVEVWDQVGLAAADIKKMHVSISTLQLFGTGKNSSFRTGYFTKKADPS
jgi:hypothetical protein